MDRPYLYKKSIMYCTCEYLSTCKCFIIPNRLLNSLKVDSKSFKSGYASDNTVIRYLWKTLKKIKKENDQSDAQWKHHSFVSTLDI